jgi:hypothetical protein
MLVPLRIVWRDPSGLGTADAAGVCRCDDGCDYVIKDGTSHPTTPHNEWFCTHLGQSVGIACPPCYVILQPDGTHVFGSRWEGGVAQDPWWDMARRGEIDFNQFSHALSRILAFDHFVHNPDRHLRNFLIRKQKNGWTMLAFDYSRAWRYHCFPLPSLPFPHAVNTLRAARHLGQMFGDYIIFDVVDDILIKLSNVSESRVEYVLSSQPKNWLTTPEADAILTWWRSSARVRRIDAIRQGVRDGTYL